MPINKIIVVKIRFCLQQTPACKLLEAFLQGTATEYHYEKKMNLELTQKCDYEYQGLNCSMPGLLKC